MSDDAPISPQDDHDPEVSGGEAPQAMRLFNEPTESDVRLDPSHPAFSRRQDERSIDDEYPAEYNRRYVKEHGDEHGHAPTRGPEAEG